jgi:transcriptional regulator with PAS, ATPase and Fis domain
LSHLPPHLRGAEDEVRSGMPSGLTLAAMEKLLIRDALRRHKGNRAAAARELDIDASTLFRKIKALKLKG